MKLAICGKGGSGKSTLTALLAYFFSHKGLKVLVVDSDESNSGLYRKLGMKKPPLPLMDMIGGRKGFKEKKSSKYQPGSSETGNDILEQIYLRVEDIPPDHIAENGNVSLILIGKIVQAMEGCACPMGVLNREFLSKLKLNENEMVIVDTEAGLEHFGRGVESGIDSMIIVVDPSSESIDYTEKAFQLSKSLHIENVWVTLNKVPSQIIASKLTDKLKIKNIPVSDTIYYDQSIFEAELEGKSPEYDKFDHTLESLVNIMLKVPQKR